MTVAGSALAQSSVTMFGIVDASLTGYSSKSEDRRLVPAPQGDATIKRSVLASGAYNTSRFGFRGTEDLGGGLAASFWLEAPITNDDGQTGISTFARRATVSLSGGFGEVRFGRDATPTFWQDSVYDPFGGIGTGAGLLTSANSFNRVGGTGGFGGNPSYSRVSNSVGYFLPPGLGGFYGQLMYTFNEQTKYDPATLTPAAPNNSRTGRYVGGRFGYNSGPLDVALAYGQSTSADNFFAGTTDLVKTLSFGISYDFKVAKVFGQAQRATSVRDYEVTPLNPLPDVELTGQLIGVTIPIGPGLIRATYSRVKYDLNSNAVIRPAEPKASKISLGYVHNLSKRTALYATVARVSNRNGAALTVGGPAFINNAVFTPRTSTGYDIGIRHAF